MKKQTAQLQAACPGCNNDIPFQSEPRIGSEVSCKACGAALEVIFLRPIELDWLDAGFEDDEWINEDW